MTPTQTLKRSGTRSDQITSDYRLSCPMFEASGYSDHVHDHRIQDRPFHLTCSRSLCVPGPTIPKQAHFPSKRSPTTQITVPAFLHFHPLRPCPWLVVPLSRKRSHWSMSWQDGELGGPVVQTKIRDMPGGRGAVKNAGQKNMSFDRWLRSLAHLSSLRRYTD